MLDYETAKDLMWGTAPDGCEIIDAFHLEETRWGNRWRAIFKNSAGKHYGLDYEIGSGDSDYNSSDDWGDQVECPEYAPVQVTKTEWKKLPS